MSDEDKERYEEDFIEDGMMPEFIPSTDLNKFVFNETTVDIVLQDLMERGIKVAGGDRLGKPSSLPRISAMQNLFWNDSISYTRNITVHSPSG